MSECQQINGGIIGNGFGADEARMVSDALKMNCPLTRLCLGSSVMAIF